MPNALELPDPIRTARLLIRPHQSEDLELFTRFMQDRESTRFMAFTDEQRTPAGCRNMLDWVIESYTGEAPVISLTIADPATNEYRGSCGIQPMVSESDAEVEVYYTLLKEFQGHGYATEALQALIDWLWRDTACRRAVAHVVLENLPSVRVAERVGFSDAGSVERTGLTGRSPEDGLEHRTLEGRRYVLDRPVGRSARSEAGEGRAW